MRRTFGKVEWTISRNRKDSEEKKLHGPLMKIEMEREEEISNHQRGHTTMKTTKVLEAKLCRGRD